MILIDANIFMYAAGAEHPYKEPSRKFLERVARHAAVARIHAAQAICNDGDFDEIAGLRRIEPPALES